MKNKWKYFTDISINLTGNTEEGFDLHKLECDAIAWIEMTPLVESSASAGGWRTVGEGRRDVESASESKLPKAWIDVGDNVRLNLVRPWNKRFHFTGAELRQTLFLNLWRDVPLILRSRKPFSVKFKLYKYPSAEKRAAVEGLFETDDSPAMALAKSSLSLRDDDKWHDLHTTATLVISPDLRSYALMEDDESDSD